MFTAGGGGSHWKVSHPSQAVILTRSVPPPSEGSLCQTVSPVFGNGREPAKEIKRIEFPVIIEPLAESDGGGFVAFVPDLPGCMSDGETPELALASVQDAIAAWIEEAREIGRPVPRPSKPVTAAE
jgi:antitoxin HicB